MEDKEQHPYEQKQQQHDEIEIEIDLVDEVLQQEQIELDAFDDTSSMFEGYL